MKFGFTFLREETMSAVADALPNSNEPAVEKTFQSPQSGIGSPAGLGLTMVLWFDAGSATATVWIKEPTTKKWLKRVAGFTVDSALAVMTLAGCPFDAQYFVQLTGPAGSPTKFGVAFI